MSAQFVMVSKVVGTNLLNKIITTMKNAVVKLSLSHTHTVHYKTVNRQSADHRHAVKTVMNTGGHMAEESSS